MAPTSQGNVPRHSTFTNQKNAYPTKNGRCRAFFVDARENHFALVQWYGTVGNEAINKGAGLPMLKLEDEKNTRSYDIMPVNSIVNGALLVTMGNHAWAMISPRETAEYILSF